MAFELAVWSSFYLAYLAVRGATIGDRRTAVAHATAVLRLERTLDLAHEQALQRALGSAVDAGSAYYMLGFGPTVAGALVWLAARDRRRYRELRTLLLLSLGLAMVAYVAYPTAPPRGWSPASASPTPSACTATTPARSSASASTRTRRCPTCTSAGACSSASPASGRAGAGWPTCCSRCTRR